MKRVFADTFYFIALLNPADQGHRRACATATEPGISVVTTRWVLVEFCDAFSGTHLRAACARMVKTLLADPKVLVCGEGSDVFDRSLDHYAKRPDKEWSLTDCISFVVMAEESLTEALTADHHFEQAGFVALLK